MSTSQSPPYFQRAWQITLNTPSQDLILSSDEFSAALRVTFRIEMVALLSYWIADVDLWNLNQGTISQLQSMGSVSQLLQGKSPIVSGNKLSISAGYKYGSGGVAFDPVANLLYSGSVFQPMYSRQDVVDSKLTLRCLLGYQEDALNFVSCSVGENKTANDAVNQITSSAQSPISKEQIDTDTLSQRVYTRPQVFHGRPYSQLRQIAKNNNLQCWVSEKGLNLRSMKFDPNATADIVYSPPNLSNSGPVNGGSNAPRTKPIIIGVPQQTQDGVLFRVLLDAQPKIGTLVQLVPGTAINQLPLIPNQTKLPAPNPTGLYIVSGLKHVGDSRPVGSGGNDWYTEIQAVSSGFFPDFALAPNVTVG